MSPRTTTASSCTAGSPRRSSTRPDQQQPTDGGVPEVMTAREVAVYLRLNYNTVLDLTKAGGLPALAVGREHRYLRTAIDDTMRSPTPRTAPTAGSASASGTAE